MQYSIHRAETTWIKFKELGYQSLKYKREAQLLIPELARSKIYKQHGFATLTEAASKTAGIGKHTIRKILSVERRTSNLPELKQALEIAGYTKVDTVLCLAEKVSEKNLVDMVMNLPAKALRQKVKEIKRNLNIEEAVVDYHPKYKFTAEFGANLEEDLNRIKQDLEQSKGHPVTNRELLEYLVFKAKVIPKQVNEPRNNNKSLTPRHRAHVKSKNNNICQAKNCHQVASEIHHENYQSITPKNHKDLKAYCRIHHQLAHYEPINKTAAQKKIDKKVQSYWRIQ